jgi:hypothetical protein
VIVQGTSVGLDVHAFGRGARRRRRGRQSRAGTVDGPHMIVDDVQPGVRLEH